MFGMTDENQTNLKIAKLEFWIKKKKLVKLKGHLYCLDRM